MDLPVKYKDLTWQERRDVRSQYWMIQGGKCYHCGNDLSSEAHKKVTSKNINKKLFPESFFKHPVHLHHCHKTGMTIGAVHNICNAVLWQYHGE